MRKIMINIIPYICLLLLAILLTIIWWPSGGNWIQLSNSWIALFVISTFCAIFLFQEEINHYLDRYLSSGLFQSSKKIPKKMHIPVINENEEQFQELIAGTVFSWMEKVNIEKVEKKLTEGEIQQAVEQFKKVKRENIRWQFLLADYLLVPRGKEIIHEIYERHYLTEQMYEELVSEMNIDLKNAEDILAALEQLRFIRKQDGEIIITEAGSAYCTFLEQNEKE